MIVARAPLRISFGGGGTDLPAYYERHGGHVLSTTIEAACHVRLMAHPGAELVLHSLDYGRRVVLPPAEPVVIDEPLSLPRAVAAWFAANGCPLRGLRAWMRADVPPGSGLGSSSAMAVALVAAFARAVGWSLSAREVAEIACAVEIDLLGRPIGRQDQYAAAFGGVNAIAFSRDGVAVRPLRLDPEVARSLEAHLLLVSTRQTRDSAAVLRPQRDASATGGVVVERLDRIKALGYAMADALADGDLPRFGALLDDSWQLKRGLSAGVTTPQIDRWYALARQHGAYGGKIAGAGGGGHFIFCVPPPRRAAVVAALARQGLTALPVALERRGCVAHGRLGEPPAPVPPTRKGDPHELVRPVSS